MHSAPARSERPRAVSREPSERVEPRRVKAPGEVTFFAAVIGDTLSQQLGDGLDEAFADAPQIGVLHKGKENSGLVRSDYFDWIKAGAEIAGGDKKPQMAVVMIGSNDRQSLGDAGRTVEPLTPRWQEIYAARVDALIQAFKEKDIPLVWVGLPIMKNERFSADMAELNDIYRASAGRAQIPFIDLWEIFADEHGRYSPYGPDVNGQRVKLRAADGVHFTSAGARKVAHFVEGEVKRLFDARQQPAAEQNASRQPPAEAPAQPPASPPPPPAPLVFRSPEVQPASVAPSLPENRPAIGPMQSLTGAASGEDALARREKPKVGEKALSPARAVAEHIFVEGGAPPTRPGRADDSSWPAQPPKAQAQP